jgi:hypothetical protein
MAYLGSPFNQVLDIDLASMQVKSGSSDNLDPSRVRPLCCTAAGRSDGPEQNDGPTIFAGSPEPQSSIGNSKNGDLLRKKQKKQSNRKQGKSCCQRKLKKAAVKLGALQRSFRIDTTQPIDRMELPLSFLLHFAGRSRS